MRNKLVYFGIRAVIVLGVVYLIYLSQIPRQNSPKCPNEYPDNRTRQDAELASMDKFYKDYPGTSYVDWEKDRLQYYKDNNCTTTLREYDATKTRTASSTTTRELEIVKIK